MYECLCLCMCVFMFICFHFNMYVCVACDLVCEHKIMSKNKTDKIVNLSRNTKN